MGTRSNEHLHTTVLNAVIRQKTLKKLSKNRSLILMKIIIDFFLTFSSLVKAIELLKGTENWGLKNLLS